MEAKRSALGLTVLGILAGEPMHAYRIQKLIKDYGKDRVVNVRQRASIYQAIERLLRLGLVEVVGNDRTEGRPERTVYAITAAGRETALAWVREMLTTVGDEFPEFPVGLSFLMMLGPEGSRLALESRLAAVERELAEIRPAIESMPEFPRIFLLEDEYRYVVRSAERDWLAGVIADLKDGKLDWSEEWIRRFADEFDARSTRDRDRL